MTPESDVDASAARSVLDRVGNEIEEQLPQSRAIARDRYVGRERKIHRHPRTLAQYERGLVHFLRELAQIDAHAVQVESSLVRTRKGEQTLHQIRHASRLVQRFLECDETIVLSCCRAHRSLHVRTQHCKRRLELVA